jgi:amidase
MKRRQFLITGSSACLAFSAYNLISCESSQTSTTTGDSDDFVLNELTIDDLQQRMQNGELTSRSITELYLKRIDAVDENGVALNSVIELNPDAITIAEAMDKERKEGKVRSGMHGIPVLIKDNIDTGDKMMTTAGALALEGNLAKKDAFIISQLRNAGAVVIGKTNLSEWANFRADRSSSGWSSRGGQTKNPYVLDRNPCGSSSGSGTAVAANLCAVAIGTETNGSIACPSSLNGIVGIKPTVGLLSRSGIIPISHTQDTAGPMARTVKDAAIMLGALTGEDPADSVTLQAKGRSHTDYTAFLKADGLNGKRIGVEKSMLKKHESIDKLLLEALETMKSRGATIIEVELIKKLEGVYSHEFTVLQHEFKDGVNRYLANANAKVKSLTEVIEFNRMNEAKAMPFFKQEILESSDKKPGLDDNGYKIALDKILTTTRGAIDSTIRDHQLNAICGPTTGPAWCTDLINGDFFTGYAVYSCPAMAGYPHVTVPMGLVFDLPVGISFMGQPYQEPELLSICYAYEQASKKRVAPKFLS